MTRIARAVLPPLAVAAAAGMFLVLVMGATVTTTGSAEGCGRQWPLCNGKWVPDFAVAAAIEFSHRAVTAVESVLILAVTGLVLLFRRQRRLVVLALLMTGALVAQAAMGALAVVAPQDALVLALHFGISLVAVGTSFVAAVALARPRWLSPEPAPSGVFAAAWGLTAYLYALTYTGAYVRHAAAGAACLGWPVCRPVSGGLSLVANVGHRSGAVVAVLLAIGLNLYFARAAAGRSDLRRGAAALLVLLGAQAGSGGILVLTRFSLGGELGHAAVTGLVFCAAAYLCLAVSARRRGSRTAPRPVSAGAAPQTG